MGRYFDMSDMGRANPFDVLSRRGLVEWCSSPEGLKGLFESQMVTGYVGFDPSADSLHVGNMVPIMGLAWLQRLGHRPLAIVGGGTGLIGDPSGKSKERPLLTQDQVVHNMECIREQLALFLDFDRSPNGALIVNNYDWLKEQSLIGFLRDTGKFFTVNYMISREYIRSRLEDPDKSITYTEMSYMLLQAFDFWHLYRTYGCKLQMGGNDQQGNILAGVDLIRKKEGGQAYGFTFPLLLTSTGQKFGKSEEGAVYLSPKRTSPYKFYQFWMNVEDDALPRLFRMYTFLDEEEIDHVLEQHMRSPEKRVAQRMLAMDMTRRVHGPVVAERVARTSEILFGDCDFSSADLETVKVLEGEIPTSLADMSEGDSMVDLMALSGVCASKGEARRLLKGGGVYVNGRRIDEDHRLEDRDVLFGRYVIFRLGKKKYHLVIRRG
jgi:tyrosyl-tRNA synthetase